ncbi:hypothetical protein AO364_1892 [Moraxella catarrhalis]|nr:hypothetical protein AO364_1892 [Moraxella catarrhalis]
MTFASSTRTPQSMPAKFDWFLAKNGGYFLNCWYICWYKKF